MATRYVEGLNEDDLVIFLLSGGGSAVFEKPYKNVTIQDITIVTDQLLASGLVLMKSIQSENTCQM